MPAKPTPGASTGTWGQELNDFLDVSINADGTLKTSPTIDPAVRSTLNASTIVGATSITTPSPLKIANGQFVSVSALTTTNEVRQVTAGAGTTTLTLSSGLNTTHTAGDNVFVKTHGARTPAEWYGCVARPGVDSYTGLQWALWDQQFGGGTLSGISGAYYTKRPLLFMDYGETEDLHIIAYDPMLIDPMIGTRGYFDHTVGVEPDQFLAVLAGQTGTISSVDTTANTITLSATMGADDGDKIMFFPYPGATLPAPLEAGRQYYKIGTAGVTVQISLNQFGTAIDITSAGTGTVAWGSPGLARMRWMRPWFDGANIRGLNGVQALTQQPSYAFYPRIQQFTGPRGALVVGGQEGHFYGLMCISGTVGLRNNEGMGYFFASNFEQNEMNYVHDGEGAIIPDKEGRAYNNTIVGAHFELGSSYMGATVAITGNASVTAGTFTATFRGQTTPTPIAYNASAATIQTRLEELSNIAPGDISVAAIGGLLSAGGTMEVQFLPTGAWSWIRNNGQLTVSSSLTGGTYGISGLHSRLRNIAFWGGVANNFQDCLCNGTVDFFTRENNPNPGLSIGPERAYGARIANIYCTGQLGNAVNDKLNNFTIPWADSVDGGASTVLQYYEFPGWHGGTNHEAWWMMSAGAKSVSWESVAGELRFRNGAVIRQGAAGAPIITTNAGNPEGVVTAGLGSLCTDSTNGELYVKKTGTGNTGWKLVTHA